MSVYLYTADQNGTFIGQHNYTGERARLQAWQDSRAADVRHMLRLAFDFGKAVQVPAAC
jgi:hypothetical protein